MTGRRRARRADPGGPGLVERRWWGWPGHGDRGRGADTAARWEARAAGGDRTSPGADGATAAAGADEGARFPVRGPMAPGPEPVTGAAGHGRVAATGRSGWRQRWYLRLQRLSAPEVVIGGALAAGWAAAAVGQAFRSGPILFVAVAVVIWLHATAVETGSFTLAWMTTVLVVLLQVVALGQVAPSPPPALWAVAASTALAHNEMIRLSYARRRQARVDRAIYTGSALAVVRAGALAVLGIGLAQVLSRQDGRTWLWMPATAGVLLLAALALTLLPARRGSTVRRERWRPGDRLPPPPLPLTRAPADDQPAPPL